QYMKDSRPNPGLQGSEHTEDDDGPCLAVFAPGSPPAHLAHTGGFAQAGEQGGCPVESRHADTAGRGAVEALLDLRQTLPLTTLHTAKPFQKPRFGLFDPTVVPQHQNPLALRPQLLDTLLAALEEGL